MTNEMEMMNFEQLDQVAGGTREEFEEMCRLLGKNPTFSTRKGIAKLLKEKHDIEVLHWNTGDRGSKKNGPAEFRDAVIGINLTFSQVKDVFRAREDFDRKWNS